MTELSSTHVSVSPYVSRAELLSTFEDDRDFVQDLVTLFVAGCPAFVDELRSASQTGNIVAFSRAAHSLKGSISYFDRGDGYVTAQRMEKITSAELQTVSPLLDAFELRLLDLARYLSEEFPTMPSAGSH